MATMTIADLKIRNEGNIFLVAPITEAGASWIEENLPKDRTMWGRAVVVEHHYIAAVVTGALADGLHVS
jgi:hypothetical protein